MLAAWAFLPVMANGYYWFHDVRMLYEAAPAWIALGVIAVLGLASSLGSAAEGSATGADAPGGSSSVPRDPRDWRGWAVDMTTWATLISVAVAAVWGAPTRWSSYQWSEETLQRITVPPLPADEPVIVFVHTSWNERLSSRLQGAGRMRQDSVSTPVEKVTNVAGENVTPGGGDEPLVRRLLLCSCSLSLGG